MRDCVIIGGGVAGLAAATRLATFGRSVTLVEALPRLGGRTYSYRDRSSDEMLDNGQHLLMGCYTSTLEFLRCIGIAEDRLVRIPLDIPYRHRDGRQARIRASSLPSSMSNLSALLRFTMLNFRQRLSVLRVANSILANSPTRGTEALSVHEWLLQMTQDAETIEYLWAPIVLATMNASLDAASAQLFQHVLHEVFLGGKESSAVILPAAGLSALLVDPAAEYILTHGGEIRLHEPVEYFSLRHGGNVRVRLTHGSLDARSIIAAIPADPLKRIVKNSAIQEHVHVDASAFEASPILSIHLWTNVELTQAPILGLLGTRLQWMFSKGKTTTGQWLYALTISAAGELAALSPDDIRMLVKEEIHALFPNADDDAIRRMTIMRDRSATFIPKPGIEASRLPARTSIPSFFLAGDWTDTGLPATIEGAVRSGVEAAEGVERYLSE